MPTFDTPAPISVTVQLGVGDVRIGASDRRDTIVEVRPSDESKKSDVTAARETRVEYASGRLLIKAPKGWRQYSPVGGDESIDVRIELPEGSQVRGEAGVAAFHSTGRLGECHFKTGIGEIQIEHADGPVELQTGVGDVTVNRALGHADVTTSSGSIRVGSVDGTAVVKNSNGDTWIGEVTGDLRVRAANGRIVVDQAGAAVVAKTANGDIRLGDVSAGAILAETALGKVDVGIRDGVAAWLDLSTRFGNVHSDLDSAEHPWPGDNAVEVRARSAFGDISIRHAPSARTAG
jgi:DUF4097 and DUF4098 domain-containing protein YvlB